MSYFRKHFPNLLTVLRLFSSFLLWFPNDQLKIALFVFAIVTEFLDGFLARLWDVRSTFGQILDPIADKFFSITMITVLVVEGKLGLYHVFAICMRDLMVIGGALSILAAGFAKNFKKMPPLVLGKVTTVVQFIYIADVLLFERVEGASFWAAFFMSFLSACDYLRAFFQNKIYADPELKIKEGHVHRMSMLTVVLICLGLGITVVYLAKDNVRLSKEVKRLELMNNSQ